jgi:hypothetical protein
MDEIQYEYWCKCGDTDGPFANDDLACEAWLAHCEAESADKLRGEHNYGCELVPTESFTHVG